MSDFKRWDIDCKADYASNSKMEGKFRIDFFEFNYKSVVKHQRFLDKIIQQGIELSIEVNEAAANNSNLARSKKRIENNAVAGLLAEYSWKGFLNKRSGMKDIDFTEFDSAANQIDLINQKTNKKIEVRSSFPRNGILFAICNSNYQFDILGPYSNNIKPGEVEKSFYLRTLYHVPKGTTFFDLLKKDGFRVYLTGGATWSMMTDKEISITKSLTPQDSYMVREERSEYRVVPFSRAIDNNVLLKKIFDYED